MYFIARDGKLCDEHILPYLVTTHPRKLPPFSNDPELWRLLWSEAEFFGLYGLLNMLHVTNTFQPEDGDRGVLYWLGTGKGTKDNCNPHSPGAVDVTGWVDMTRQETQAFGDDYDDGENSPKLRAPIPRSRQALV